MSPRVGTPGVSVAHDVIEALEAAGIRYAFTVPGESFLGILDALRASTIRTVATRHESGASFMAEAVSKLTSTPALCLASRAPGAANLLIGLHTALHDSTPLVAIVGQVSTGARNRDSFQEVDLASMLRPVTKWCAEATSARQLPELVADACRRSVAGRTGPVAVCVPDDLIQERTGRKGLFRQRAVSAAPDEAIARTLDLLRSAHAPLIIAGGGVLQRRATSELEQLAEALGVPVISAFRRHDVFPNDNPLYLGSMSLATPPTTLRRFGSADVVLAIGTRLSELTTRGYLYPRPETTLVHIDEGANEAAQNFASTISIAADPREVLMQMLASALPRPSEAQLEQNRTDRQAWDEETTAPAPAVGSGWAEPARVVDAVNRFLPANAVVASDAGNFSAWVSRYIRSPRPRSFVGATSGAMGYAVPAAIAAALVVGRGIAIAGDGGFLMTSNELATAAKLELDVTCVVFDNQMYGTIKMHQERAFPGRQVATDLWSPDFAAYAAAFGGKGFELHDDSDIDEVIRAAMNHRGISLVHVPMAPAPYLPQTGDIGG